MLDGPLMLPVNLPLVDTIHPESNTFVTGVKIKAIGESTVLLHTPPSPGCTSPMEDVLV